MGLTYRGAMQRQCHPDGRGNPDGAILWLRGFERDDPVATDDRDERALAALLGNIGEYRAGLPHQAHVMDIAAAHEETFDAEPIVFVRLVLFDVAARFEGRKQAEDVVLMELEALGEFSHAEFVGVAKKLFEYVKRMGDGLNNVVCLLAPDH